LGSIKAVVKASAMIPTPRKRINKISLANPKILLTSVLLPTCIVFFKIDFLQ
jgi:hypothetical protein